MKPNIENKEIALERIKIEVYSAICYIKKANSAKNLDNLALFLKTTPNLLKKFFMNKTSDFTKDFDYLMKILEHILDQTGKNSKFKSFKKRMLLIEHSQAFYCLKKDMRTLLGKLKGKDDTQMVDVDAFRQMYAEMFELSDKIKNIIETICVK